MKACTALVRRGEEGLLCDPGYGGFRKGMELKK